MKTVLFLMLSLVSATSFAETRVDPSIAAIRYNRIKIYEFVSVDSKIKFIPKTALSWASYQGRVDVTVKVEGNLCQLDPKSLGTLSSNVNGKWQIELVGGAPFVEKTVGCPMFSRPIDVTFSLYVDQSVREGETLDRSLGTISALGNPRTANPPSEVELHIRGNGSQIDVTAEKNELNQE